MWRNVFVGKDIAPSQDDLDFMKTRFCHLEDIEQPLFTIKFPHKVQLNCYCWSRAFFFV